jgi:hypothetical protein
VKRTPWAHDEVKFEDAVGDRRKEEEERSREDRGGKERPEGGKRERDGQDDESECEGAEEPLNPIRHDEHSGPPDVFLHTREGDVGETQNHRYSTYDSLECGEQDPANEVHRDPPGRATRSNPGFRPI